MYMIPRTKKELLSILGAASKDQKILDAFLTDLLSPSEYEEIVRRWQLVKLLDQGMPQREIAKKLGVSIATVTRGSRALRDQKGGFNRVLKGLGTRD
jgi:TrpR family transcriptional regulator, trp operon repressor